MEHGDALREIQRLEKMVERFRARDIRRRDERRELQDEIRLLKGNVGELNSMIARQARTVETKQSSIRLQAAEIATKGQRIRELETALDDALAMIQESDDDAPNLALAACKKKLEQLEGMLEGQRRSTRELGVNLQRARDEKTLLRAEILRLKGDLNTAQERAKTHQTQRDDLYRRNGQTVQERDQYLKDLQDLQRRVNRAKTILAPTVTMDTSGGSITWDPGTFVRGPVKKAEPRLPCAASFPGVHGGHRCERTGDEQGRTQHLTQHRCHCGWVWD